jgi:MFS superfamily sulfate permease-like transporter
MDVALCTTVISGVLLVFLGKIKMLKCMTYLPTPVLSGFFACVSYSM